MTFLVYFIVSYIIMSCILAIYLITYEKDNTGLDFDRLQCEAFCNMLENKEIVNKLNNL